jgi:hypothetical protein
MGVESCIRVGSWFLSAVCLLHHYAQLEKGHQKKTFENFATSTWLLDFLRSTNSLSVIGNVDTAKGCCGKQLK